MLNDANGNPLQSGIYVDNRSYFARTVEVEGEEVSFGNCFPQRTNCLSPEGQARRLVPFEEAYLEVVRKLVPLERASTTAEKRLNFQIWLRAQTPQHPNLESQINQALELLDS